MQIEPPTPSIARGLGIRRNSIVAVTALACAAVMSACGSSSSSSTAANAPLKAPVNIARLQTAIAASILTERHLHATVVCPTSVPKEVGGTFECVATTTNTKPPTKTSFVVTIKNTGGYVEYVGK